MKKINWKNLQMRITFSSGVFCCNRLPRPKPKKLIANMGATPAIGADMPLYRPRNPSR